MKLEGRFRPNLASNPAGLSYPPTLHKPLPLPSKTLYPWWGSRVELNKGQGRSAVTPGLPCPSLWTGARNVATICSLEDAGCSVSSSNDQHTTSTQSGYFTAVAEWCTQMYIPESSWGNLTKVSTHSNFHMGNLNNVSTHLSFRMNNLTKVSTHSNFCMGNLNNVSTHSNFCMSNLTTVSTRLNFRMGNLTKIFTRSNFRLSNSVMC